MSSATDFWTAWLELLDKLPTSVAVANYSTPDTVTYVLSDDQIHVRLIVHHAEKKSTEESRVNIIAPNLVKMLTEGTERRNEERNIDGIMRGREELAKRRAIDAQYLADKILEDVVDKYTKE